MAPGDFLAGRLAAGSATQLVIGHRSDAGDPVQNKGPDGAAQPVVGNDCPAGHRHRFDHPVRGTTLSVDISDPERPALIDGLPEHCHGVAGG